MQWNKIAFYTMLSLCCMKSGFAKDNLSIIPVYQATQYDNDITTDLKQLSGISNQEERIIKASSLFLDKPYVLFPNGEANYDEYDKDPLYRTDAFDCLTFVSTVIALVDASSLTAFVQNIKQLDYQHGQVKFIYRNHFTSSDYNPNNQAQGYITDITLSVHDKLGHPVAEPISVEINKPNWFRNLCANRIRLFNYPGDAKAQLLINQLHAKAHQTKAVMVTMPYIPLEKLFTSSGEVNQALIEQIPSGSIIEIVRPNWLADKDIGTKVLISHLGFVIASPKGLMFREASSVYGKVTDVPFVAYLRSYYFYDDKADGINIEAVNLKKE